MKKQIFNPFLPLDEYVPDGEAHVFGDRVYLYGSHDAEGGERFCMGDYVVYSAPIDDLSDWRKEGVSYKKEQDPRSQNGKLVDYYAPDCVRGEDGRYYLYYVAMGPAVTPFGPISVAVSSRPEGPFAYYGDVHYPDGHPVLKYGNNDPAVLNDEGRIHLYYGWGFTRDFRNPFLRPLYDRILAKLYARSLSEIRSTKPSITACAHLELEKDMLTAKGEPVAVLPSKTTAPKGSLFYAHPFYEAPSIRKFGDRYYLVYSSGVDNALVYAVSSEPDRGFEFGGVLISSSGLGYQGNREAKYPAGTIHGCVEAIGNNYYVFYHRCTHNTDFSRQACAERIHRNDDGSFEEVRPTTQGLNPSPLFVEGSYPAEICCELYSPKRMRLGNGHQEDSPNIVCRHNERFIHAIGDQTWIGYRDFAWNKLNALVLRLRGAEGDVEVHSAQGTVVGSAHFSDSRAWENCRVSLTPSEGNHPLFLHFRSWGKIDLISFSFEEGSR